MHGLAIKKLKLIVFQFFSRRYPSKFSKKIIILKSTLTDQIPLGLMIENWRKVPKGHYGPYKRAAR